MSTWTTILFNGGQVSEYHVFCRDKYLGTLVTTNINPAADLYAYNHAFIYHREAKKGQPQWWRADSTPYPKEQVPKAYLGMSLLVT